MKQIPPIPLKDRYWRDIKQEIERLFIDVLFRPLYEAASIKRSELRNAPSTPLEKAISSGKVWYTDGRFHGQFSAAISREIRAMGGKWNRKSKTFTYAATLPAGVQMAVAAAAARYDAIRGAVLSALDGLNIESIDRLGNLPDKYIQTIEWMEGDWKKAVKGVTVSPELTDGELNGIAVDYAHNTGKYIKGWAEETIMELREEVQRMVYDGQRPDAIARLIESKYGQSKRKAEFLAKQESKLMMSSFHRRRMEDVGVRKWRWMAVMDERTRRDHRMLDGKVFLMGEPPIADMKPGMKTGERAYPGEPFGCRCQMIGIIE